VQLLTACSYRPRGQQEAHLHAPDWQAPPLYTDKHHWKRPLISGSAEGAVALPQGLAMMQFGGAGSLTPECSVPNCMARILRPCGFPGRCRNNGLRA
jgi:hypothetical protein